jgi:predicted NAD/FAD-binding protein
MAIKTAIIGTGIAGMGAAHLLNPVRDITVYEKNPVVGGHTRALTVDYGGAPVTVDTGFIVFNRRNYPHLTALFNQLQVPVQNSNMTFAITVDGGRFEWGARDLNAVFGQRRNIFNPCFWILLRDVMRFNSRAVDVAARHPDFTLGQLVKHLGLGRWFLDYYILPMGGAIWSCPPSTMLDFPAATFVNFFKNHGLLSPTGQPQWETVQGASGEYVKRITAPYAGKIRTNCGARRITRIDGPNGIKVQVESADGRTDLYDEIVLACHADEALRLLADATPDERAVLGAFTYQKNIAVLHRDISVMPRRRACWASWVYHTHTTPGAEPAIGVTYWMNLLQSIDDSKPLFVTLNPAQPIAPDTIFNVHEFDHPVFTQAAIDAQAKIPTIQGVRGTWFCGAYQRYGFHEDGLLSAVNVAKAMGVAIPWL